MSLDTDREASPRARSFVPLDEAARRLGHADTGWREAARTFPVRWPEGYLELAETEAGRPVRRMGVPSPGELLPDPGDIADPVGEAGRQPVPFVVRKHRDRAILVVTSRCHFYCRFCFRRAFPGGQHRDPSRVELDAAIAYLTSDPEIREVILSGGDPLVLSDERLEEVARAIGAGAHVATLRVHTRAPVHHPERVTPRLLEALRSGPPLWVVTHFNHAVELRSDCRRALDLMLDAGVPLLNQSVLLAGVNDCPEALAALFRGLDALRVKPYYLHHPDRVPGNAAFRVSIARGLAVFKAARAVVPGPAVPVYVIDLPDGSGKVPVETLEDLGGGRWRAPNGHVLQDIVAA